MVASNIKTTVPLPSTHQHTQKTTVYPHPHAPPAPCPESPQVRRRSLQASCVGRGRAAGGGAVDGVGVREGGAVRLQPDGAGHCAGVLAAHGGAGQDLLHAAGEVYGRAGHRHPGGPVGREGHVVGGEAPGGAGRGGDEGGEGGDIVCAEPDEEGDEAGRGEEVKAELQEALQSLEKQKEDTIKALDSQIAALSDEIVKKVLPTT